MRNVVFMCEKVNYPPSHRGSLERSLALRWGGLPHHKGWVRAPPRQWLDPGDLIQPKWLPYLKGASLHEEEEGRDRHERPSKAYEQKPLPAVRKCVSRCVDTVCVPSFVPSFCA